jgi:hypothetical protein
MLLSGRVFAQAQEEAASFRPYIDHFEKIESYVAIVCGPAMARFGVNPYTFREYEEETSNSVFKLRDTLTSRAEISDLARLFDNDVVAIIGLGGSGGYVLDFMVKTPFEKFAGSIPDSFFA